MQVVLAVAAGGAAGSVLRYALSSWVTQASGFGGAGTFVVNILGAFGLGLLFGFVEARVQALPPVVVTGIAVGVFGGFTTFSSFMWDAVAHAEAGRLAAAIALIAASIVCGLAAMVAGLALGRAA